MTHLCPRCGSLLIVPDADCPGCLLLGGIDEPATLVGATGEAKADPAAVTPLSRVGVYEISSKLGEGGTAEVYLAKQREPIEREVAFKLIRSGMDSERVIARFEAERQILARLQHPFIASILDAGRMDGGRPYFVMEYVAGLPVTDFAQRSELSVSDRLELFLKICQAVEHAHQLGIIHRDLKPSNILVAPSGDPKVIDFGIARVFLEEPTDQTLFLTREGDFLGTPAYMSPEQRRGQIAEIDTRTDVYSLGVILYELLTGQLPFETSELRDGKTGEARKPSSQEPRTTFRAISLRGDLDWISLKALSGEKERRYAGVASFAEDIRRHLASEPVLAGPPTASYRVGKFVRRHRGLSVGVVIATFAILAGSVVSIWKTIEATQAKERAEENYRRALASDLKADQQLSIANAVNRFLIDDLLNNPSLNEETNPNVTVVELIDRASGLVDERFGEAPHVATALHLTIGNTYQALGRYDESYQHFGQSKFYAERIPEHPESAATIRQVTRSQSIARLRQGRLAESRELLERYLKLSREEKLSEKELLPARVQLASQVASEGNYLESISQQVALIEEMQALESPDDGLLRQTQFNLALNLKNVGQPEESIRLLEGFLSALEDAETIDGAHALTELASCYQDVGAIEDAEKRLLQAIAIQEKLLSPGHPQSLNTKNRLASLWDENNQVPKAIELYREIITLSLTEESQEREQGAVALHNLALVLMATDLPQSEKLIRRAIEERAQLYGNEHPQTVSSRYSLGLTLWYQKKYSVAVATMEEVIAQQNANFGPHYPDTLWSTRVLATILFEMEREDEAMALCEKILAAPLPENEGLAEIVRMQQEKTRTLLSGYGK